MMLTYEEKKNLKGQNGETSKHSKCNSLENHVDRSDNALVARTQ